VERIKKYILPFLITIIIGTGLFISAFGPVIFQEGNPVPLLVSAAKLQFGDSKYVQFSKTEKRSRYLSESTGNNTYDVVKEYMKAKGWKYQEQMGSGLIFSKDGEDAVVEVRQYSKHYFIWEIQKAFFQ
jgi:hypothetical protein